MLQNTRLTQSCISAVLQAAINQLALDNTDQRACFDSHMAKAEHDADGMKVRAWGTKMPE